MRYVLPEAGGSSAHSVFSFLSEFERKNLLAVDARESALKYWALLNIPTQVQSAYRFDAADIILPSAEYWNPDPTGLGREAFKYHNKLTALSELCIHRFEYGQIPEFLGNCVLKETISSGSKGVTLVDKDTVAVQKIDVEYEVVVDYNHEADLFCPRKVYELCHGRDVFGELIYPKHSEYGEYVGFAKEILSVLGVGGIGNVQFLVERKTNTLFFSEIACRLSGSSWVNRLFCNLWSGKVRSEFFEQTSIPYSTQNGQII